MCILLHMDSKNIHEDNDYKLLNLRGGINILKRNQQSNMYFFSGDIYVFLFTNRCVM